MAVRVGGAALRFVRSVGTAGPVQGLRGGQAPLGGVRLMTGLGAVYPLRFGGGAVLLSPGSGVAALTSLFVRIGGVWRSSIPYVRVSGAWKQAVPRINISGVWK